MLRLAGFLLMMSVSPASAQGWENFSHDLGTGAAVCPYDDPDSGAFFCFALACLPGGNVPHIRIALAGGAISAARVPLQVHVDGRSVARLFLNRLSDGDMRDYGIPVDPARDTELIEALRVGSRATLVFGIGLSAIVQNVSLSGSQVAIDRVELMCHSVPLTARTDE